MAGKNGGPVKLRRAGSGGGGARWPWARPLAIWLGIPALVLGDGSVLIDSPVICEYLNHIGGGKFFPGMNIFKQNSGRWKALGLQALGDGLADAAVAWTLLGRADPVPEAARARQKDTVLAALDALEKVHFAK